MVVCNETLILQIMAMVFTEVAAVILMGHIYPFETQFRHRLEMFNEVCLMFVIYAIICFSPFVTSYQRKHEMGFICCGIIGLNLSINLFFMVKETV
jgi:hypothetical protein